MERPQGAPCPTPPTRSSRPSRSAARSAIGSAQLTTPAIAASEPLPTWARSRSSSPNRPGARPITASLTVAGQHLLRSVDGISLQLPHRPEHTVAVPRPPLRARPRGSRRTRCGARAGGRRRRPRATGRRVPRALQSTSHHPLHQRSGVGVSRTEWAPLRPKLSDGRYELTPFRAEIREQFS